MISTKPSRRPAQLDSSEQRGPETRRALGLLVPLQLFLAAGWLRAGVEKVIDLQWWTGAHLQGFLDEQRPEMLPFFGWFSDHVLSSTTAGVSWLVVEMQLAIAICLVTNRHVKPALWSAILLNVCFTMAGRVNPSAFYLVMELALLFGLSRPIDAEIAVRRAALWLVPALVLVPFARTLHPARVIDDPALMLAFLSVIAAATTIAVSISAERLIELASTTAIGRRFVR